MKRFATTSGGLGIEWASSYRIMPSVFDGKIFSEWGIFSIADEAEQMLRVLGVLLEYFRMLVEFGFLPSFL